MEYKPLTEQNCKDFKNFKYSEFKCKCGGKYCNGYPVPFSYDLAKNLQNIREHFGKAVHITSPLRCNTWNEKQGGVKNSLHKLGFAVDFYISGISYNTIFAYAKKLPYYKYAYRIKKGKEYIHYSITPPKYNENNEEEEMIEELKKQIEELNNSLTEETNKNNFLEQNNKELEEKIKELNNSLTDYKFSFKCPESGLYKIKLNEKEVLIIK